MPQPSDPLASTAPQDSAPQDSAPRDPAPAPRDPVVTGLARVDDALLTIRAQTVALGRGFDTLTAGWQGDAAGSLHGSGAAAAQELRSIEAGLRQLRLVLEQSRRRRRFGDAAPAASDDLPGTTP